MNALILPLLIAFPTTSPLPKSLLDLQHRAVDFFVKESHPVTGLTKDRAANNADHDDYAVASTASTGFALVACALGTEKGWLKRADALDQVRRTVAYCLKSVPHEHGFSYHFIDWSNGKRIWNCEASTIDTSILLAGMLAAERYFKDAQVTRDVDAYARRIDWKWAMTNEGAMPNESFVSMGYKPESGFISARWSDYNEAKMLYIQAYGFNSGLSTRAWDAIRRRPGTYQGIDYLMGGPLFMHQMTECFYTMKGLRDRQGYSYFVASRNAALANRAYCITNPKKFAGYGPNLWGLSACDFPTGYSAFGAPGDINDDGTITPTSAIASYYWLPKLATDFYTEMRTNHASAWGRYGFPNGYNANQKWIDKDVIGIDLGMMMCNLANAENEFVSKLSMQRPEIRKGYQLAGLTKAADAETGPLQRK